MTNHNAADIRGLMDLLASVGGPTILSEAPFTGVKAAFGDKRAMGELQRQDLANRMKQEWGVWLGQTGKRGTIEDMVKFLNVRVGLEPDDIRDIMGHEQVGQAPNPNIDEPREAPTPQAAKQAEPVEPEKKGTGANDLTPEQQAELDRTGRVELENGKVVWKGQAGETPPPTLRKIKNDDVQGAVNDLTTMTDEELDKFMQDAISSDVSDEEWAPIEAELQRRQDNMESQGKEEAAEDLADLMARLEKELNLGESRLNEAAMVLSKKQANMVFDDAAKYVFAHGILDREMQGNAGGRGRGSVGASLDSDGVSAKSQNQINAFLRQHDINSEIMYSLRETSRRARGLGAFKGSQDHKILALIGLAYLKYRD